MMSDSPGGRIISQISGAYGSITAPSRPRPSLCRCLRPRLRNATPGAEIGENTMRHLLRSIALIAGITALASPAPAKIQKFEITRVESPAFEGRSFGAVGTYDRIIARATIAVSPDDPHNAIIVDLDRAPHNPQGVVEAVADVEILRPTIAANGNRRLFYEVRQPRQQTRGWRCSTIAPRRQRSVKASDAGNGFLMNRGYTHRVERLAGRHRARRRPDDVLAARCARRHRPRTRGVYLRPQRTIRPVRR